MEATPWLRRFRADLTDDRIKDLVRVAPSRPDGLGANAPEVDAALLEQALRQVCEPTDSVVQGIRALLELAQGHAAAFFPSANAYWRSVFEQDPVTQPAICLTGLAGVGKSVLIAAFCRLLQSPTPAELSATAGAALEGCWLLRSPAFHDFKSLMSTLAYGPGEGGGEGSEDNRRGTVANLADAASRRARRQAVCLLITDETQFETLSTDANARMVKKLLLFLSLGPRLVYSVNYSMVHRLLRRSQEERDRLTAYPMVILPDSHDSADWQMTVSALLGVAPDAFAVSAKEDARALHRYTYGIKRKLATLLVTAYRGARRAGRTQATMDDVQAAYRSMEFTTHRSDVETLIWQDIEGGRKRDDLFCPFPLTTQPKRPSEKDTDEVASRIAEQALLTSLTQHERAGVDIVSREAPTQAKMGNVIQMPRASKDALLAAAQDFYQSDDSS